MPLNSQITALWAKKATYDRHEYWLPLITHLQDTSNVIVWLYQHRLSPAQKHLIQGTLSETTNTKLIKLLGFFHDFGKATPTFQVKKSYQNDKKLDQNILNRLLSNDFTDLEAFNNSLPIRQKSPHALAGEALLEKAGLNTSIGAIIGGHHGKPTGRFFNADDQIGTYNSNYYTTDKVNPKWQNVYDQLINYGLAYTGFSSLKDIPTVNQTQAILLEGLLIMADWLASSKQINSKPLFPLIPISQTIDNINEEQRFNQAMKTWTVDDQWKPAPIKSIKKLFNDRWNYIPTNTQLKMIKTISSIQDPGLILIESGCGTGKTEIALASTEELAYKTKHSGLFFGLPTQATANAIFDRVDNWLSKITQVEDSKLELNLLHSKAKLNQVVQQLPQASNINTKNAIVANSWFTGKKSILINFNVATIDNLLMMSLKQKHLFLRHLALSGKIVIIDEIHAYDTYMNSYLALTLRWLGAYHVPVIALSATLPAKRRHALLKAYNRGKFGREFHDTHEHDNDYPLLTYLDGNTVHQENDFNVTNSKIVTVKRLENNNQILINTILDSIKNGGITGIIVNTVKRAQKLTQQLQNNKIPVLLLHSAFLAPDREKLEKKLTSLISKNDQRPDKLIVIGTQVLEQSLDIDFDVLFTDIAPIDLLIQRIGRLQRHRIKRPKNLKTPTVYITGINSLGNYGTANSLIYSNYYLTKTDYFLPDQLTLPQDTPTLIQKVYDENNDDQISCPELPKFHKDLNFKIQQEQQKAKNFQIDRPTTKPKTLHGWLDNLNRSADTNDQVAQAVVRDIKPTIEVILLKEINNQYFTLDNKNISNIPDKILCQETIRLPITITNNKVDRITTSLQNQTKKIFPDWQDNIWLRNASTLILDKNNQAQLNNYLLNYDSVLGLTYKKERRD